VVRRTLWGRNTPTPGGCTTCTETCGSGAKIGMTRSTMRSRLWMIPPDLPAARTACFAAVAGSTRRGTAGRRSASGTSRRPGTTTWASVPPKFWRTSKVISSGANAQSVCKEPNMPCCEESAAIFVGNYCRCCGAKLQRIKNRGFCQRREPCPHCNRTTCGPHFAPGGGHPPRRYCEIDGLPCDNDGFCPEHGPGHA